MQALLAMALPTLRHTVQQLMASSFPLSSETRRMIAVNFFPLLLGVEVHMVPSITSGCFNHCYCCAHTDSE